MPEPDQKPDVERVAPVVLGQADVQARRVALCAGLRRAREQCGRSIRAVTVDTGVSTGTLWRIENGRVDPHWSTFALLANQYDLWVDLELPGRDRPWRTYPGAKPLPEDYWPCSRRVEMVRHADTRWHTHDELTRIGAELWWARRHELDPPLDAAAAARLLGINRSTLRNVEHGAFQPRLSTVILAAGLTGRRLALVPRGGAVMGRSK